MPRISGLPAWLTTYLAIKTVWLIGGGGATVVVESTLFRSSSIAGITNSFASYSLDRLASFHSRNSSNSSHCSRFTLTPSLCPSLIRIHRAITLVSRNITANLDYVCRREECYRSLDDRIGVVAHLESRESSDFASRLRYFSQQPLQGGKRFVIILIRKKLFLFSRKLKEGRWEDRYEHKQEKSFSLLSAVLRILKAIIRDQLI